MIININGFKIGDSYPTFIIAEAGVNHNGNIELAKKLIKAAKNAGADAVKFQTFSTDRTITRNAPQAKYQKENTGKEESQYDMVKRLELSPEDHFTLARFAREEGIMFLSTPFDFESVDLLESIGVPAYKIGSGEITNTPLLRYIASKNKPIILSTGMSTLGEIEEAIHSIKEIGNNSIALLHCTSNYPPNIEDTNLYAIRTLQEAFKLPVGYSDHTIGITIPIAAVALGAKIIEKHFTLDKNLPGPDHLVSLEPEELKEMIESIRMVEKAFGNGIKRPVPSEFETRVVARKSVVVKTPIKKDEIITMDKITFKRPGTGILPKDLHLVLNRRAKFNLDIDHIIKLEDLY
ncbi:N-acetylneuraminate synthase [Parageobacillus toebii]|uniref:N-acetylneuraminate synthase n=1 Tax=Parageobacillus toebii TaxID=153151 RepID=UPI0035C6E368